MEEKRTQSVGLSERHLQYHQDGNHLSQDSIESEANLKEAMLEIKEYAKSKLESHGLRFEYCEKLSTYDIQKIWHSHGGPEPNPDPKNKTTNIRPDGGIIMAILPNNLRYPVFIGEDKVQGSNDKRFSKGLARQATGNAIERGAKNIRASEILCSNLSVFPYCMFVSGCDFHDSETISKRLEQMNYGFPIHYIDINKESTPSTIKKDVSRVIEEINISKKYGKDVASVFVKAHKWNAMPHGSSRWKKDEIVAISKRVVDQAVSSILKLNT